MVKTLAARIVYAPKDFSDAREISDELGTTTVKGKSVNKPMWGSGKQRSTSESDQRRPLMLPQEVKDIGVGKAIIFYEGLRPIFCEKIRYFEDKRLKARLEPAPMVRTIDTAKVVHGEQEEFGVTPAAAARATATGDTVALDSTAGIVMRPVTAADVANLDSLDLEDFSVNFDHVEIPQGRPLTNDEMRQAVDALLDSMAD
jgi:type IV secretion system protein VirD4